MARNLGHLLTEQRNPDSARIDEMSVAEIIDLMNREDANAVSAVARERERIAAAIELIVESFRQGGRLFYVGAGTSGRLGVLDAAECPPTFGTDPSLVQGLIAGGPPALVRAAEGAEDRAEDGAAALDERGAAARDVVVGIAASGVTPYVRGALERASEIGCATVFVTCNARTEGMPQAEVVIAPLVGPEVVTGSTRLKAGTATKLVLNMLTTAAMVKLGKVYGNLMVDLRATSAKLRDRSLRILKAVLEVEEDEARALLQAADGRVKTAIAMHWLNCDMERAQAALDASDGFLRRVREDSPGPEPREGA